MRYISVYIKKEEKKKQIAGSKLELCGENSTVSSLTEKGIISCDLHYVITDTYLLKGYSSLEG